MTSKLFALCFSAVLTIAGCSNDGGEEASATGGTTSSGGQAQTGGAGGGSGGTTSSGGTTASGGRATGGSTSSGGTTSSGGSGSGGTTSGTGGRTGSGGATGGTTAKGGTTGGGGTAGAGGTTAKGGAAGGLGGTTVGAGGGGGTGGVATGGASGTGGATSVPSACGLPPGPSSGVAKPSGSATKLDVLPWAGFKAATSFSLDDGTTTTISNYSALNGTGVKFTFYLVTGWSGANDPIWKTAIKDGHEIGNHTQSHSCGTASAGQSDIKSKLGVTAYTLAAPNGDTSCGSSVDSLNLLLNRGVNGGSVSFTADDSTVAKNLPTSLPPTGASAGTLTGTIDGAYNKGEWQTFCIHGFSSSDGSYQPIPIASLTDAIKTEKQKKDLWIDTMQAVGAYWRAGRAFAKATKTTAGSETTWKWTVAKHIPPNTCLRVKPDGGVVKQNGVEVPWDDHGYYEISFNAGEVTLSAP